MNPTPTTNSRVPFVLAEFATLAEGLDYAARGETGYNFYSLKGELAHSITYAELRDRARDLAQKLTALGLPRHGRAAILAETIPEFHVFFFACQYAGLLPVPLPLPINLGGKDAYIDQIRQMLQRAQASIAVSSDALVDILKDACSVMPGIEAGSFADFAALSGGGSDIRPLGADEPCYIQFSSGSTSSPKGVTATQKSATSNMSSIVKYGLACRQGDRATSWLPLYHDMGLVGFALAPAMMQVSIDYLSTSDFARRPLLWPRLISDNGSSLGFSPSFGYDLCARRARSGAQETFDLTTWRVAGIGGDMVRADVLDGFVDTFAPMGFRRSAFIPSYGMAEATLAITFAEAEEPFERDTIDLHAYAGSGVAKPVGTEVEARKRRTFVNCGKPMPGHDLEVRLPNGKRAPDRAVGKIFIKGPSNMAGYFQDPEATDRVIDADGWLDTGDMGYLVDGNLYVTGRSKDLIIVNGRNIWPQDIEWAVERLPEIRSGGAAAFAISRADGTEAVVTVVECRVREEEARHQLVRDITSVIRATAGVNAHVVLAPLRSLTITSSGKLSRAKVKDKYLAGAFSDPMAEGRPGLAAMAE